MWIWDKAVVGVESSVAGLGDMGPCGVDADGAWVVALAGGA